MKKIMLSFVLVGSLSVALQAGCYGDWLNSYKSAEDQLSADLFYCRYERPTFEIFRLTGTCTRWAYADFNDSVEAASSAYAKCNRK